LQERPQGSASTFQAIGEGFRRALKQTRCLFDGHGAKVKQFDGLFLCRRKSAKGGINDFCDLQCLTFCAAGAIILPFRREVSPTVRSQRLGLDPACAFFHGDASCICEKVILHSRTDTIFSPAGPYSNERFLDEVIHIAAVSLEMTQVSGEACPVRVVKLFKSLGIAACQSQHQANIFIVAVRIVLRVPHRYADLSNPLPLFIAMQSPVR
jgi:hypothetical protein